MSFQILPLPETSFAYLNELSEQELAARNIDRHIVTFFPGTPCRVTLDDAQIGETVFLLNWEHLPEETPYRASHAIFVRAGQPAFTPPPGELAPCLLRRPISVRAYDRKHRMSHADVAEGEVLADIIANMFENSEVAYIHLHNAKPGCFAASVVRAQNVR